MYKCIPTDLGVDISTSYGAVFSFTHSTYDLIDLGNNNVKIQRKIDGLYEVLSTPISYFTDLNMVPVATTYAGLNTYFNRVNGAPKAGEGISVVDGTISVVSGGPSTLGGFKLGTGLVVDGQGRLSANAVSEVTKILATEAEMLALATETLRPYRIIRLDTKRLYYLNAGDSPAVLANWFVGPSIETMVLSFKGRTGAVSAEFGDYNFDLIPMTDKTSGAIHKLVIDDAKLYIENTTTSVRKQIAFNDDIDLNDIQTKLDSLDLVVNNQATGLVKKVNDLTTSVNSVNDVVNNNTTGLVKRVVDLEARPSGGTDYSAQITALQNKDVQQDTLIQQVDAKVDSVSSNNTVLDQRVTTLENRPAATDYSTQITALQNKDIAQDTRITAAEAALLTKAGLVAGKVPYDQLPEFTVGRKVNVANRAARLALSVYNDLTIAYESDTGDAWGLDANDNPAIEANWSKLGNSMGVGVSSFNGRTGNIGPMVGDYDAGKITELVDKRFVTQDQITRWDAASNSGVTSFNGRAGSVLPLNSDYTADMITETTSRKFVTPAQVSAWDSKETTTGAQTKATSAQTNATASAKTYADNTFIQLTQKATANGVATLNASSKIPVAQLPTNVADGVVQLDSNGKIDNNQLNRAVANGIAPLDANSRVPVTNLPTFFPQVKRIWRDVKASRVVGQYYTNNSPAEQLIFVRHKAISNSTRFTQIVTRASSVTQWFTFTTLQGASNGSLDGITVVVPGGWEYAVTTGGGTTDINMIDVWYEFY
jgi:hypothetical protein